MFGQRLKALRKEKGLTQAALAYRLGLTQQAVGKWEAGLSSPDPDMLVQLARLLGVGPERFFDPADSESPEGRAGSSRNVADSKNGPDRTAGSRSPAGSRSTEDFRGAEGWPAISRRTEGRAAISGTPEAGTVRPLISDADLRPFLIRQQKPVPILGTVKAGYGLPAEEEFCGTASAEVNDPRQYFYLVVRGDSMEPRIRDGDLALVRKQPALDDGDLGVVVYGDGEGTLKRFHKKGNAVALQPFNPAYETLLLSGEDLEKLYIIGKVIETKARW